MYASTEQYYVRTWYVQKDAEGSAGTSTGIIYQVYNTRYRVVVWTKDRGANRRSLYMILDRTNNKYQVPGAAGRVPVVTDLGD